MLASRSPRRQELLGQIGVSYHLIDIEIDESVHINEPPIAYVDRMAYEKGLAGWSVYTNQKSHDDQWRPLLAADTSVVLGENILGKPESECDARDMLRLLSGKTHQVMTSVALVDETGVATKTSITDVTFCDLRDVDIEAYLECGEGKDKAGSYAIQGFGAMFIRSINGSYSGVVGLPLYETNLLLEKHFKG